MINPDWLFLIHFMLSFFFKFLLDDVGHGSLDGSKNYNQ